MNNTRRGRDTCASQTWTPSESHRGRQFRCRFLCPSAGSRNSQIAPANAVATTTVVVAATPTANVAVVVVVATTVPLLQGSCKLLFAQARAGVLVRIREGLLHLRRGLR